MTNALTTIEACPLSIPSNVPMGWEKAGDDAIILPRIDIVQSSSDSFKSMTARLGQMENSITKEIFSGPEQFILLAVKEAAIYITKSGKFICRSNDAKVNIRGKKCVECPHGAYYDEWVDNKPPLCSYTKEFLAVKRSTLLTPEPFLGVVSMKRTQIPTAKQIINGAKNSRKPLCAKVYSFDSQKQSGGGQDYYGWKIAPVGWVTQEEFDAAVKLSQSLRTVFESSSADADAETRVESAPPPREAPIETKPAEDLDMSEDIF